MQLRKFTLQEINSTKHKLHLKYNYGLEITLKKYWFITTITVKKHDDCMYVIGFNNKNLLSQYHQGKFDDCINYCLSEM